MVDLKKSNRKHALNQAMELLHFGYRAFVAEADQILEQQGLGRVHHRILYFVAREPGITVGNLRETLAVSKQAMHGPLRKLETDGLILSANHVNDKRSRCLSLSELGNELEQQVTRAQHRLLDSIFANDLAAEQQWRAVMMQLAERETDRPLS